MNKIFILVITVITLMGCSINKLSHQSENEVVDNYADSNPTSIYYFALAETALMANDLRFGLALLRKADYSAPKNIYVKEKIFELLDVLARHDSIFYRDITSQAETYIQQNRYSARMLIIAANAYARQDNFARADQLYQKAIDELPAMWIYLGYYSFKLNSHNEKDTELLYDALELPWKDKKIVLILADVLRQDDAAMAREIAEKAYDKWDDVASFMELISIYENNNERLKTIFTIQDRIDRKRIVPDNYNIFLLNYYFTQRDFSLVVKNKEIALSSENNEILHILFFSALEEENYKLAIYVGNLLEETEEIPEELITSFYADFALIYFLDGNYKKSIDYILKQDSLLVFTEFVDQLPAKDHETEIMDFIQVYKQIDSQKQRCNYVQGMLMLALEDEKATAFFDKISIEYLLDQDLILPAVFTYLTFSENNDRAYELLNSRINKKPTNDEIIGLFYYNVGKDSLAFNYFRKAVINEEVVEKSVYIILSFLGEKYSTPNEVAGLLAKGSARWNDPEMKNLFAYYVADMQVTEMYVEAEDALISALKLDPENAMIWDSLAWLYFRMGRYQQAYDAMKLPKKIADTESEIAYHLGEILLSMNRLDEAKAYLLIAVKTNNHKKAVEKSKIILKEIE